MGKDWNYKDLTGQVFWRLTVILDVGRTKDGNVKWLCSCSCGNTIAVSSASLVSGNTKSCGCIAREYQLNRVNSYHYSKERLYRVWNGMKNRCTNPNIVGYHNYGGRGISVCQEWMDNYMAFREWAYNNGYDENASKGECTLDRIDVNGDYCPENCRWVGYDIQFNNKRTSKYVEYKGNKHTITEWASILGMNESTLYYRIYKMGWNVESAFTKPVKTKHKKEKTA